MTSVRSTIDKFGRSRRIEAKPVIKRGPPGVGFKLTDDGSYDIQSKLLKNVGEPTEGTDGATRNYVDACIDTTLQKTLKALNGSAEVIVSRVRSYVDARDGEIVKGNGEILDKKVQEVMGQMRALQEAADIVIDRLKSHMESENTALRKEVTEQLRSYVNQQIDGVKGLNIATMNQNNALVERIEKVEQALRSIKGYSPGRLALPTEFFGSEIES